MNQDIRDRIAIEHYRVQIQNHPNYPQWRDSLKPFSRWVFDFIMDGDITPDLVQFCNEAPDDEWDDFQFLRIIGGTFLPHGLLASTSYVLGDILDEIDQLGRLEE